MLAGCFWFAVMGVLAHAAGRALDWQAVALARSGLATLFAVGLALLTGARLAVFGPPILWVRSVAGSLSMVATFYALTHLPVSDVLTITNTFPVWVALLSWPLAGERPTAGVWAAVGCAVAGVAVTLRPTLAGFPPAGWAAVWASAFTAVAMLGLNRLKGVSALGVVAHFSAVSTLFCGAAWVAFPRAAGPEQAAAPGAAALLLGVGATATAGQVFLTRAFRAGPATNVSVVGLSQVVMVMAFEAAAGWKRVDGLTLVGTALVLGPAGWLMVRAHRLHPAPPPAPAEPPDAAVVEEVAIE